jgi:hypothetical protein
MKKRNVLTYLALCVFIALSCSKTKDGSNNEPQNGYVKGKVVDSKGTALKDVTILIDNTIIYNSYLSAVTAADGSYQIKLVNGAWIAYAEMNVPYNGKTYKVNLHPDNAAGFGIEGAVRNFSWKLTGQKPTPLTGHYGGTIIIDKYVQSSIYDSENIEFTLTPVGKLIDGSDGQVITTKHGQPSTDTYGKLVDIPIGRYAITAVYTSSTGNVPLKLRNKLNTSTGFTNSLQVDFEPTSSVGNNMAVLEYYEG